MDGRGTIVVDGAHPSGDDDDTGPGLDIGNGDGPGNGDPDGFGDADADADGDADAPGGDADADADSDADGDGDILPDPGNGACVPPAGPFGSQRGDTLAEFPRPLPECGTGVETTLADYCEANALVIHFNSPG